MKIKLSARDILDKEYDPDEFNPESTTPFQSNFNATNLARELFYEGYKSIESMSKQFKLRNYKVDAEAKKIMQAIIDKFDLTPSEK